MEDFIKFVGVFFLIIGISLILLMVSMSDALPTKEGGGVSYALLFLGGFASGVFAISCLSFKKDKAAWVLSALCLILFVSGIFSMIGEAALSSQ